MKEKNQIVKLSKFFKILSNIMMVLMIIAAVFMAIIAIFFAIGMKSIEVKDGALYAEDKQILKVEINDTELALTNEKETRYFTLDKNAANTANYLIEHATNNSITLVMELIFFSIVAMMCLYVAICIKAKNIFKGIIEKETPFVKTTSENLKVIAILLGVIMAISIVLPILISIITKMDINLNIPLAEIIAVVFILFLGYISEYGYKLENTKKGK